MSRIYSIYELKHIGRAISGTEPDGMPLLGGLEKASSDSSSNSIGDGEQFYSADDEESEGLEFVTPRISLAEELQHPETAGNSGAAIPTNDSDLESLKSISECDSIAESWVNEATTTELVEQLHDKTELAKKLFEKLQATEAHLASLKLHHETQIRHERAKHASILVDQKKQFANSVYACVKKYLADLRSQDKERSITAEGIRLAELAEAEKRAQECNEDWTAERNNLMAKLEAKNADHCESSQCTKILDEEYKYLNWQATEAQRQLQATAKPDSQWWKTVVKDRKVRELTFGEIADVIDDLRMKLHKLASAGKATEKSTISPAEPKTASGGTPADRVMSIDALVHPSPEQAFNTTASPRSQLQKALKANFELEKKLQAMIVEQAAIAQQNKVLLRDNTVFQEHAGKVAEEKSRDVPCYCQGANDDDSVEVPLRELKNRVRKLRKQIADIKAERDTDKEMHEKLKGHYFSLHAKYQGLHSNEGLLVTQEKLSTLERVQIPALESQKTVLVQEVTGSVSLFAKEKLTQEAKYDELRSQHSTLCGKYTELQSSSASASEVQSELKQQLADLELRHQKLNTGCGRNIDAEGQKKRLEVQVTGLLKQVADLKLRNDNLEILETTTISELERQKTALQQEMTDLKATQEAECRIAVNAVRIKFSELHIALKMLEVKHRALQEAHRNSEWQKVGLRKQLTDLKISGDEKNTAQIARYLALETKYSSVSRDYNALKSVPFLGELRAKYDTLEFVRVPKLITQNKELKHRIESMEKVHKRDTTRLKEHNAFLSTKYTLLTKAHTELKATHDALCTSHATLQANKDDLERQKKEASLDALDHETNALLTYQRLESSSLAGSLRRLRCVSASCASPSAAPVSAYGAWTHAAWWSPVTE
jgi:hypothetical protein